MNIEENGTKLADYAWAGKYGDETGLFNTVYVCWVCDREHITQRGLVTLVRSGNMMHFCDLFCLRDWLNEDLISREEFEKIDKEYKEGKL